MSITKHDKPALIWIDIQKAFDNLDYKGGQQNNINAENNTSELLRIWRVNNLPIFHIRHWSSNPNSLLNGTNKGNKFKDSVMPINGK